MKLHQKYMQRALKLAKKGTGFVSPNPLVGAVIVRDESILGEGFHASFGGSHAEVAAIRDAEKRGQEVAGATLYVTLEPCTHFGKTPPCADLIIEKKIAAVVIAMPDPNPVAAGGAKKLIAAGIQVRTGCLQKEAEEQNRFYLHGIRNKKPFFTVKIAVSANGMVAEAPGKRTRISGREAEIFVHSLRQDHDAILVGAGTVEIDYPLLSVRHGENPRDPVRVIIDPHRRVSRDAEVFRNDHFLLVTSALSNPEKTGFLNKNIIQISEEHDTLPAQQIAAELWKKDIRSVLIEGGPTTIAHFLKEGLVDELILIRSKKPLPETGVPLFPDGFPEGFEITRTVRLEEDEVSIYERLTAESLIGDSIGE